MRLERCIEEVGQWMSANCLKLNADKMGAECDRTSRQQHPQVRPWTVTDVTCRLALA